MKTKTSNCLVVAALLLLFGASAQIAVAQDIVHDAEYYILKSQNGERWAAEDGEINAVLSQMGEKYGQPPIMMLIRITTT